jgi:cytochrome P450
VTTLTESRLDDPAFYATNPVDVYARLRAESPVHWYERERRGFWVLSKHEDIVAVSRQPELFSSATGVTIDDVEHVGLVGQAELPQGELMLVTDPPRYRDLRKVLAHHFTHAALDRFAERIREIVLTNLANAAEQGEANFVETVSMPTAIQTICAGLDLPPGDWRYLKTLTTRHPGDAELGIDPVFGISTPSFNALCDYFNAALDDRRAHPRGDDDWLTTLTRAEAHGAPLPRETALLFCIDLLMAGNDTTDGLLSIGTAGLAEHPDQRELLRAQPDLIGPAVEELLRWVTPVIAMARTATADTEVRGQRIAKGDYVVLLYAAANRDEDAWGDDAERIDIRRARLGRQIAFGTGIHVCIGAHLSRLESRIMFSELLERYPDYAVTGPPTRVPSTILNAFGDLPVTLLP